MEPVFKLIPLSLLPEIRLPAPGDVPPILLFDAVSRCRPSLADVEDLITLKHVLRCTSGEADRRFQPLLLIKLPAPTAVPPIVLCAVPVPAKPRPSRLELVIELPCTTFPEAPAVRLIPVPLLLLMMLPAPRDVPLMVLLIPPTMLLLLFSISMPSRPLPSTMRARLVGADEIALNRVAR